MINHDPKPANDTASVSFNDGRPSDNQQLSHPSSTLAGSIKKVSSVILSILAYVVCVAAIAKVLGMLLKTVLPESDQLGTDVLLLLVGVVVIAGILISDGIMARSGRSRLAFSGWPGLSAGIRGFGIGGAIGLGMVSSMFLMTLLSGGGRWTIGGGGVSQYLGRVIPLLGCLLVAALWEEWLFRGYPMTKIATAYGRTSANLAIAILFSAAHAAEAGFNPIIAANIVFGSMVIGALRFSRGGIPAAWGFHFVWNGVQAAAGSTLSGMDFGVPVVNWIGRGPQWASGGEFGAEGGIGATVATLTVLAGLAIYSRRRRVDLGLIGAATKP